MVGDVDSFCFDGIEQRRGRKLGQEAVPRRRGRHAKPGGEVGDMKHRRGMDEDGIFIETKIVLGGEGLDE